MVRNVIVRILEGADFQILEADSAVEALTVASRFEGVIDLLISDHFQKTLTGPQVAEQIRQTRPGMKVLHISGYPLSHLETEKGFKSGGHFLAKPFTAQTLTQKVIQIIEGAE